MPSKLKTSLAVVASATSLYLALEKLSKYDLKWNGKFLLLKTIFITLLKGGLRKIWRLIDKLFLSSIMYSKEQLFRHPPSSLEDVRKEWLSHVLKKNEVLPAKVEIESIEIVPINTGQTGHCGTIKLSYANEHLACPETMIIKMSRQDFAGMILNIVIGLYRECFVYRDILSSMRNEIPTCEAYYFCVSDWDRSFILLLEDASKGEHQDLCITSASTIGSHYCDTEVLNKEYRRLYWGQPPPSHEHAFPAVIDTSAFESTTKAMTLAVESIAAMHAKHWCKDDLLSSLTDLDSFAVGLALLESDWVKTKKKARSGSYEGTSPWRGAQNPQEFEQTLYDTVFRPMQYVAKMKGVNNWETSWSSNVNATDWVRFHKQMGFSRIHGDFHTENIFFRTWGDKAGKQQKSKNDILILDWQICNVGIPIKDVAQILCIGGLDLHGTRLKEEQIVRAWWRALIKNGVKETEYPFSKAWAQYKYFSAMCVAVLLMLGNTLDFFSDDHVYYMHFVDKFQDIVEKHGHPTDTFLEMMETCEKIDDMK
jgi:hypothetical protein